MKNKVNKYYLHTETKDQKLARWYNKDLLFVSKDTMVDNYNVVLTGRQYGKICSELKIKFPNWDDSEIELRAREIIYGTKK